MAEQLERRLEMPRAAGLALALVATLGAAAGVVVFIAPAVNEQVRDFLANLPQYLSDLDRNLTGLLREVPLLGRGVSEQQGPGGLLASSLSDVLDFLRGAAVPYLRGGVEFLIEGISVLVMAVYLARTPGSTWTAWWRWCRPRAGRWRVRSWPTSGIPCVPGSWGRSSR